MTSKSERLPLTFETFNVSIPEETAAEQIARFGRQIIEASRGF